MELGGFGKRIGIGTRILLSSQKIDSDSIAYLSFCSVPPLPRNFIRTLKILG